MVQLYDTLVAFEQRVSVACDDCHGATKYQPPIDVKGAYIARVSYARQLLCSIKGQEQSQYQVT